MCGKKIVFVFALLVSFGIMLFGDDFNSEDLNGVWLTPRDLKSCLSYPHTQQTIIFSLWDEWFIILWDNTAKTGIFQTGTEQNAIKSVEFIGKRVILKYFPNYGRGRTELELVLEYVSRDSFRIISSPYHSKPDYLIRIGDFSKKPQAKGRINNYGVRFRNRPELTSDVWFHFDFGEGVEIIGISEEKQTIGDLEAYWYEVRMLKDEITGGGLDGWVFGAYLDVENRAELEERLKKLRRDGG